MKRHWKWILPGLLLAAIVATQGLWRYQYEVISDRGALPYVVRVDRLTGTAAAIHITAVQ